MQKCELSTGTWDVLWDGRKKAFVQQRGRQTEGVVVQPWRLKGERGLTGLTLALTQAAALVPGAPCRWQAVSAWPAPRSATFLALMPRDPKALALTEQGEVPDPVCGAYGASTHGVQYFLVDQRWPGWAVFVDEGQERPLFEPASITLMR